MYVICIPCLIHKTKYYIFYLRRRMKMNYGCQSMVKKIDTIMIKRPENAFVSQENLDAK